MGLSAGAGANVRAGAGGGAGANVEAGAAQAPEPLSEQRPVQAAAALLGLWPHLRLRDSSRCHLPGQRPFAWTERDQGEQGYK